MTVKKTETAFMILLAGSTVLIGTALFTQFVLGWYPCPMCFWQREPHYVIFAVFLVALLGAAVGSIRKYIFTAALVIAVVAYLVAAYRAGFHVGVEQLWWKGWEVCGSGGGGSNIGAGDLLAAPVRDCTVPTMILPGISMALAHFGALCVILTAALYCVARYRVPPRSGGSGVSPGQSGQ